MLAKRRACSAAEVVQRILNKFPNGEEHRTMINVSRANSFTRRAVLAAVLLAGSCALWAQADQPPASPDGAPQGQRGRGPNAERELGQLTESLSLTPDQQTQVRALLQERRGKVEALRSGEIPPSREQMEVIRKDTDAKISALLNDEQKLKFATWQQRRMQGRRGPGGNQPPPPPPPPQ
jgi:Spy/CpxP family protein refolding chaperone